MISENEQCDHRYTISGEREIDAVYQGLSPFALPKAIMLDITVCATCGKLISADEAEDA